MIVYKQIKPERVSQAFLIFSALSLSNVLTTWITAFTHSVYLNVSYAFIVSALDFDIFKFLLVYFMLCITFGVFTE